MNNKKGTTKSKATARAKTKNGIGQGQDSDTMSAEVTTTQTPLATQPKRNKPKKINGVDPKNIKAGVIGINTFPAGITDLRGCRKDAEVQKEVFLAMGVLPENIVELYDNDGTQANILSLLKFITTREVSGPMTSLLHIASHGSYKKNPDGSRSEIIITANHTWAGIYIRDVVIRAFIDGLMDEDNVMWLFDLCNSGGIHREVSQFESEHNVSYRYQAPPSQFAIETDPLEELTRGIQVGKRVKSNKMFGFACGPLETASDATLKDPRTNVVEPCGAFSWAFQSVYFGGGHTLPFQSLMDETIALVKKTGFKQNPEYDTPSHLKKTALLKALRMYT